MEKRYVKIEGDTNFCGTSFTEFLETTMSDCELNDYCKEKEEELFNDYNYLIFGWDTEIEDIAESGGISLEDAQIIYDMEMDSFKDSCECDWIEITKEEYEENK